MQEDNYWELKLCDQILILKKIFFFYFQKLQRFTKVLTIILLLLLVSKSNITKTGNDYRKWNKLKKQLQ